MSITKVDKMNKTEGKKSIQFILLMFTVFFNVWFPKAGLKISGIPLTVGNVFFFALLLLWLATILQRNSIKFPKPVVILLVGIVYFIFKYSYIILSGGSINSNVTYIIPLILYPFGMIIAYEIIKSEEQKEKIINVVRFGFYFICFYALLQFVMGIGNCDIPGLTVNLSDYREMGPQWYMRKSNGTSEENAKIVSTYQNGNLFGINLIFIYSLIYYYLKQKHKEKEIIFSLILFITCTFLTLSRTCWLGLVLFIFIEIIMKRERNKSSLFRKGFILLLCMISLILVFNYVPSVAERFFGTDKSEWVSMSGRTEGLINVINCIFDTDNLLLLFLSLLIGPKGLISYYGVAFEMLPTALFAQTGVIGIVLIYAFFIYATKELNGKDYVSGGIKSSLIIWLIIGIIECGYWLPPTALNIFLLVGFAFACQENIPLKENNKIEEI